jgi:hypothetical protein
MKRAEPVRRVVKPVEKRVQLAVAALARRREVVDPFAPMIAPIGLSP